MFIDCHTTESDFLFEVSLGNFLGLDKPHQMSTIRELVKSFLRASRRMECDDAAVKDLHPVIKLFTRDRDLGRGEIS